MIDHGGIPSQGMAGLFCKDFPFPLPDEPVVEEPAPPKRLPDRIKWNSKTIFVPKHFEKGSIRIKPMLFRKH
jgi:hypothetical protein